MTDSLPLSLMAVGCSVGTPLTPPVVLKSCWALSSHSICSWSPLTLRGLSESLFLQKSPEEGLLQELWLYQQHEMSNSGI